MLGTKVTKSVWFLLLVIVLAIGLAVVSTAVADAGQPTITTPAASAPTGAAGLNAATLSGGIPVCGDQGGAGTVTLNCPEFTQVDGHYVYVVPGNPSDSVEVNANFVFTEAACLPGVAVYKVDDTSGSINGLLPGASGWPAQVALRNPQVLFAPGSTPATPDVNLTTFHGGDILGFHFTSDCQDNYYSFPAANGGTIRMLAFQHTSGQPWQFAWEDGGDFDYNDMVVNLSAAGDTTPSPDTTPPPAPDITNSPADPSNDAAPSFSFTDAEADATFLCQLDTGTFADCTSPQTYTGLVEGAHSFSVEAQDAAGNISPATSYGWTIDLGPCTQNDPRCTLISEGSIPSEIPDPSGCSTPNSSDTSSLVTPNAACASSAKKVHCAWFYDDEPIDGTTQGITLVIHQFTPHIQFHYCLAWGKQVTQVDGISASNVYKKYPWVYRGLLQDPVVGGLGSPQVKVTISMNYQQCVIGHFGCFDSRNVVLEATINAKAKDRTHPVTVTVKSD